MGMGNKSTERKSIARRLLAWVGIAGVLGLSASVHAADVSPRQSLEARVMAVRAALQDAAPAGATDDAGRDPDARIAQWLNWPNWNNWNNWPNWGNWGNWFNR